MTVPRHREQRYSLQEIIIKPGASDETGTKPAQSIIIRVSIFALLLPIIFVMLTQIGGVILLALLAVVVLGAMGYLVLSVFS